MRQDRQVHDLIRDKRDIERDSACCVRNDRSGCLQTSEEECSVSRESLSRPILSLSLRLSHSFALYLHERAIQGSICFPFHLCFVSEYSGRVGEVAAASQHSSAGGQRQAVRLSVPSGPPVREPLLHSAVRRHTPHATVVTLCAYWDH